MRQSQSSELVDDSRRQGSLWSDYSKIRFDGTGRRKIIGRKKLS